MRTPKLLRAILLMTGLLAISAAAHAEWSVGVSVGIAPPPLPFYFQPASPGDGYLWTPGYWAYDDLEAGYYWVPGTWVFAPRPGLLWTPGYWGVEGAYFGWHAGYWGPRVGFYGGIDYGFGFFGIGFSGGYWRGDAFCYNRAVTNITNVSITNVYNGAAPNNQLANSRVSYNGGANGTRLQPNGTELAAAHGPHFGATDEQQRHEQAARSTPALRAAVNQGMPPIAATPRPAVFTGHGLTAARGAATSASVASHNETPLPANSPAGRRSSTVRPYPAAATAGRAESVQPRQVANAPRTDRPAWANRGAAPVASVHPATAPLSAPRAASQDRPGASYQYRPSAHSDYPATSGQRTATASRREVRAPETNARNYPYATARAPAARSAPATRPAPAYQNAERQPPRPAYAQRAPAPARDAVRAPPPAVAHSAGAGSGPRPSYAPHDSGQSSRRSPSHS